MRIIFDAQVKTTLSKRLNVQEAIGVLMAAVNHLSVALRLAREVNLKLLSSFLICSSSNICVSAKMLWDIDVHGSRPLLFVLYVLSVPLRATSKQVVFRWCKWATFLSFDAIIIFCVLYLDQSALMLTSLPSCLLEKILVFQFSQNI